jgi:hypothetical protein
LCAARRSEYGLPWVEVKPVVRNLHLVSVDDLLTEDTVAVAESVSPRWVVQCGKRVEETSSKTTETSVSESSVAFLFDDVLHVEAELGKTA